MKYAIYMAGTGEITRIVECPANHAHLQARRGESFAFLGQDAGVSDATHYIDPLTDEAIAKQSLDTSHDVSGLEVTFHALPFGLSMAVGGAEMVTDGDDVIEFEIPGTYTVSLSGLVEYRDTELEVTVG